MGDWIRNLPGFFTHVNGEGFGNESGLSLAHGLILTEYDLGGSDLLGFVLFYTEEKLTLRNPNLILKTISGGYVMKKTVKRKGAKKVTVRIKKVSKATALEKKMVVLKKASSAKIKELELELIRLREENEYKNRRLASKDMELETYKKAMEEKVFQLQAKVKELGG
jgi:hypothetical protein